MPDHPFEIHVVTHTHWDREWYHTESRFRQRLVGLIDELLDDPPAPGESFLLDGQAVLLDDYLEVRPERAAELSVLLRDGRLEAGPWYVLADELIPSGEVLVRNLLAGRESVRRLRGEPQAVLYCPDSFGHPAALPELAHGFGCELVVLWRGYGGARWPAGDTVRWRGPAGHEVVVHHLPPDGYEFGGSLPTGEAVASDRWQRIDGTMRPRATLGVSMLLNGADHHARQPGLREALAALSAAAGSTAVVRASTLRAASDAIVGAARRAVIPVVVGELRDSYGYTWTLQGTLAARAAQKRRNARAERLLLRDVEPWIALGHEGGPDASRALLRSAWRCLLRGHPHDTLCGTSIDEVAAALEARLAATESQATGLREDAVLALLVHDRDRAHATPAEWRPAVVLRNPAPRPRGGVAQLTLSASLASVAVGPGSADRQGRATRLPPWRLDGVPLQILARREQVALTEAPRAYPRADRVAEVAALGWVPRMGGYSIQTLLQRGAANLEVPNPVRAEERALDNGLLRVEVTESGAVRLKDHASGRTIDDLLALEQHHERGDLYTPAARAPLPAPTLRGVRLTHRGPLRGELRLDLRYGAPSGAIGGRCRLHLQLDADLPALRIAVEGDNRSGDHRLRLRIATGATGATTIADAAFHPVARVPLAISSEEQRIEQVVRTAPLHRFVSRYEDRHGATIFSDGLAEYESFDDGAIAVTLLRAVGELSRHDLPERPGHAGWPAHTPAAQSLGRFAARLAIAMHGPDGPAVRDRIERLADDILLPITGETLRSNLDAPRQVGGLELIGECLAFSAAAPARRDGWIVLRCVNRSDEMVQGIWRLGRPVSEAVAARLDESPLAPLPVGDGEVRFTAAPREIVTVLVR